MMMNRLAMIAVTLLSGSAAHATEVPGNLSVVTQTDSARTVPSPNGNLTLPFQGTSTLTNQPVSFPVVISSSCTGGAFISHLEFGDGLHDMTDSSANPGTKGDADHPHTRRLRGQNLTGEYIAYKMFSDSAGTTEIKTSVTGTADCSQTTSGTFTTRSILTVIQAASPCRSMGAFTMRPAPTPAALTSTATSTTTRW